MSPHRGSARHGPGEDIDPLLEQVEPGNCTGGGRRCGPAGGGDSSHTLHERMASAPQAPGLGTVRKAAGPPVAFSDLGTCIRAAAADGLAR
jgi:hypothetical protein